MTLGDRITDFATLVALVLVLLTLFTSQRATKLGVLNRPDTKLAEAWQEVFLDTSIAIVTMILFATGLPLAFEAVEKLHPLSDSGPLQGAFAITWLMLIGLLAWQVALAVGAWKLRAAIKKNEPAGTE
jgi:hypothetical protein